MSKKSTRVLISLPDKFLDEIDQIAEEEQRSRSELIREALRMYIRRNPTANIPADLRELAGEE